MASEDRIVIQGSIVRHERISVVSETALAELEQHLVRYEATTWPALPFGTVFNSYDRNNGVGLLIVEQKPQRINIGIAHNSRSRFTDDSNHNRVNGVDRFDVMFPYQYFAFKYRLGVNNTGQPFNFTMDGYNLYWRKQPFTDLDHTFKVAAIPNVNEHGGICWGGTLNHAPADSMAVRINAMVNNFAHTTFNEDLGHRTPFGSSALQWEQDSVSPLNFLNWGLWDRLPDKTTEDIMSDMMAPALPIAQINPFHIDLPELPENFTVGRAREWFFGLDPAVRRRILSVFNEEAEAMELPPIAEEDGVDPEAPLTPQQIADALAAGNRP